MNILRENIDELNAVLKISIEKSDYEKRVQDVLKDYRRKMQLPGFRAGKVPGGVVNKMYGKHVLLEEINKIMSESLIKYLTENKLNILGEPLPSERDQKIIDWDSQTDFEFCFDVALAPEFEVSLSKQDIFDYYEISVADDMVEKQIKSYASRYGKYEPSEVSGTESRLTGNIAELDDAGNPKEEGIKVAEAELTLMVVDSETQKLFDEKKQDDTVVFNPKKAFEGRENGLARLLKLTKEQAETDSDFSFTITRIEKFVDAPIDQALFDMVYGPSAINSEEEFKDKIRAEIKRSFGLECEYKFSMDAREKLLAKSDIKLPAAFLKRWLLVTNESKLKEEDIEKSFPDFEKDLKWQLIKDKITITNNIVITEEEIMEFAKEFALSQFRQYGLPSVGDEFLVDYAKRLLAKEEDKKRISDKRLEVKILEFIKTSVEIETKVVTVDEFNKLFTN